MEKNKRQVPRLRFPGFNDAWEQRKLGELADIVRGASPRPIQDVKWFDNDSDVGWLRISDVTEQDGRIKYLAQRISKLGQEKTRVLVEPHLLLSIAATVGKPVVNYVKTGVHDGFLIFLNPKFEQEFMFQWLDAFRENWKKYGQPGSQVNLNSDLVRNQDIYIPSPQEQTAIGNFFRQLDAAIASHQRKLERVKELKKSLLQKMFPKDGEAFPELRFPNFTDAWEQRKLGKLVNIVGGGTPDTTNPEYWNGDIDWYSPTEIGTKVYANGSVKKITALGLEKSSAKILPANSTILFTSRAGIGDMAILKKQGATNQGFQSFVVGNGVNVYFLYSMGRQIKDFAIKNASGSTFLEISKNQLAKMNVIIPNEKEQTAIGNFFKQLDAAIASHQRKLEHMQTLKKGLLQQMFV